MDGQATSGLNAPAKALSGWRLDEAYKRRAGPRVCLVLANSRLTLGPEAEKRFGRRNVMELYAVFSSPQSYAVQMQLAISAAVRDVPNAASDRNRTGTVALERSGR